MPGAIGAAGGIRETAPRSLWEAMGILARVQEEQLFAIAQGDMQRVDGLLSEQAIAWSYVKAFALQLIEMGKAPDDLVGRLQEILTTHREREGELLAAKDRVREALSQAQEASLAAHAYQRQAA